MLNDDGDKISLFSNGKLISSCEKAAGGASIIIKQDDVDSLPISKDILLLQLNIALSYMRLTTLFAMIYATTYMPVVFIGCAVASVLLDAVSRSVLLARFCL